MKRTWITEAAYWLDRRASGNAWSAFYHPILSNGPPQYPQCTSAPLTNASMAGAGHLNSRSKVTIPDPAPTRLLSSFTRYYDFAKTASWELLTLLSLSHSFRDAASDLSEMQWGRLVNIIYQNMGSFQLISKTNRRQYGTLLVTMFQVLGIIENIVDTPSHAWMVMNRWIYASAFANHDRFEEEDLEEPMSEMYLNHPQRWFVAIDKRSVFPVDPVYIPIEESLVHTPDFAGGNDPRYIGGDCDSLGELKVDRRKVCERCEAECYETCNCNFSRVFPAPLVEIIETHGKGLGVRSLQVRFYP